MAGIVDNIIRFPGETVADGATADVEATAALWLARMTSGSWTLGDLAAFEFWRAASPDHDRVFTELEALWDRLGTGNASSDLRRRVSAGLRRRGIAQGWAVRLGQIAAAIVAVAGMTQYLTTWRYDYHTAAGEIRQVALADGSTVYLKGDTALNATISAKGERTVELARGEAFFEVKHDAARPFMVIAGNGVVRDIGTGFSVERNGQSTTVAVEHGSVAVTASGRSEMLAAGDAVSLGLYDMGRRLHVDPNVISPWRRGLYIAEGKPLVDVLADLDEYHPGRIIVTSQALASRRVNAVVQIGHVDALLDSLGGMAGVSVRRWGPLTIISERPR